MDALSNVPENGEAIALRADDEHFAQAFLVPAPKNEAS